MSYGGSSGGTCYQKLSLLRHMSGCRFFVFKLCRISSWRTAKHTTKSSTCTKGSRVIDRQAERTATLTLASGVLLLLLLLACRCRTAVVVVAPASRNSLCWTHVRCKVQISRLQIMPNLGWGTPGNTTKSSACSKGSRVRPTSRAYSNADLDPVCPTATVVLLLLVLPPGLLLLLLTFFFFPSKK